MNLNLIAPLNDLGYGCAGVNFAKALSAENEVAIFPIGQPQFNADQATIEVIREGIARSASYDDRAPSIRIWHQDGLAEHVGRGLRVGFPFFEMDRLSPVEVFHANRMDLYLVASEWAKGVAERSGVTTRIATVPLGVDREIFYPRETGREKTNLADTTIFFNVGKWEVRKGHDVILSAFNKAFGPHDDVLLRMCCHNPFLGEEGNTHWERRYMTSRMGAAGKIEILTGRLRSQHDVARFMNEGDVGVFPARAEGWNLDLLEAMACRKSVIATAYSAHTEYVNHANARIIDATETEPAHDGVWFRGQGEWAKLGEEQEGQIIEHMRSLHRAKREGGPDAISNAGGLFTATSLSWEYAAIVMQLALRGC